MAPALLVVQLLLPSHWEDWWRATTLPGANGWEKDCTSWARLLWSCMFPAIRKILGIIRIYFEKKIYNFNIFQDPCRYYFSAFLVEPPRRCQEGGPPQRPPQPREPRPPNNLVELRNRVGGTVEQKDLCLQTLRITICNDLQGYDGYLYGNSCGNSCKNDGIWWDMMDVGDGKAKVKLKVGWDGFATFGTCALTAFTAFTDAEVSCCPTWRKIQVLDPSFGRWGVRTRHRWSHMEFQCSGWMDGWMDGEWVIEFIYDFIYVFFLGVHIYAEVWASTCPNHTPQNKIPQLKPHQRASLFWEVPIWF